MERGAVELIRGSLPETVEVSGSGDGSGYGYGHGDGSGDGSGHGSDGSDGYGYGYGYGYGSGDGDGSSGSGDGDGDGNTRRVALSQLPVKYLADKRTIALWKSNKDGRPANGGVELRPAAPGLKQESPGPLVLCQPGVLHATLEPSRWKGERLWIVALDGPVVGNAEKMGALKREILCEVKL